VIADLRLDAGRLGAPSNHQVGVGLGQGTAGELASAAADGAKERPRPEGSMWLSRCTQIPEFQNQGGFAAVKSRTTMASLRLNPGQTVMC
jgi:hypothetical protein